MRSSYFHGCSLPLKLKRKKREYNNVTLHEQRKGQQ
ncbi:hypothetical protein AWRI1631_112060 [Saccharomyces cerevisiae AWRI1631]|uniref:Uncharacterized protein n=1 Tax=Saccharomyces cerevisiae (strain AWRI1631) TaxID=545124 RepID=B5VMD5_YEAS6|nr:hypothetical protein AWRI1631_112060 [Saccharomyces cerevisiae AWRI1631]